MQKHSIITLPYKKGGEGVNVMDLLSLLPEVGLPESYTVGIAAIVLYLALLYTIVMGIMNIIGKSRANKILVLDIERKTLYNEKFKKKMAETKKNAQTQDDLTTRTKATYKRKLEKKNRNK